MIPFVEGKEYALTVAQKAMGKFVANEIAIYAHVKKELESKESPLPQIGKTSREDKIQYQGKKW